MNVLASPFELEVRVTIKRTEYNLYMWSDTQTLTNTRGERGGWKGQETRL